MKRATPERKPLRWWVTTASMGLMTGLIVDSAAVTLVHVREPLVLDLPGAALGRAPSSASSSTAIRSATRTPASCTSAPASRTGRRSSPATRRRPGSTRCSSGSRSSSSRTATRRPREGARARRDLRRLPVPVRPRAPALDLPRARPSPAPRRAADPRRLHDVVLQRLARQRQPADGTEARGHRVRRRAGHATARPGRLLRRLPGRNDWSRSSASRAAGSSRAAATRRATRTSTAPSRRGAARRERRSKRRSATATGRSSSRSSTWSARPSR